MGKVLKCRGPGPPYEGNTPRFRAPERGWWGGGAGSGVGERRGEEGRGCPGTLREVKREGESVKECPQLLRRGPPGNEGVLPVLRDPSANAPEPRRVTAARAPGLCPTRSLGVT